MQPASSIVPASMTAGTTMPTYDEIRRWIKKCLHIVGVKNCHIAHVKADHGLTSRQAPNRISPTIRVVPCPPDKRSVIEAAFRHFGLI